MPYKDQYGLETEDDKPKNCLECKWHKQTWSPLIDCHTYWYDNCEYLRRYFAELHIVLRGEYRSLSKHDEEDIEKTFPYECPYYDGIRAFWEMFGRIQMDWEIFIYECAMHPERYYGFYVYTLVDNIVKLTEEIPATFDLHYIQVEYDDVGWFIENFGDRSVLLSDVEPNDFKYPVEPEPI